MSMLRSLTLSVVGAAVANVATLTSAQTAATPAPVEKVVVRSVAHFDFDNDSIRATDQPALLAEVGRIKNVTWQAVVATGYTDSVGTRAYNEALSKRRAAAVKAYLVKNGIDAQMVRVQGKAEEQPIASNENSDGRAQNRRTEIRFEGIRTASAN